MVVKAALGSLVTLFVLSSCTSGTYDDCLLSGMEGKNSNRAVTAVEDSCRRKFEKKAFRRLEIQAQEPELSVEVLEKEPKYLVTNVGPNIITQILVTAPQGQWTLNTWIEADRWEVFDVPTTDAEGFMKSLRTETVTTVAIKEIPTQ